jgi:hypothetical protein
MGLGIRLPRYEFLPGPKPSQHVIHTFDTDIVIFVVDDTSVFGREGVNRQ